MCHLLYSNDMSSEQSTSPVAHKSVNERTTCFSDSEICERPHTLKQIQFMYPSSFNMNTEHINEHININKLMLDVTMVHNG